MTFILLIWGANAIAFALLLRAGRLEDRVAVGLFAASLIATPLVQGWTIETWRVGVGVVNLIVLAGIWATALRGDRWWLIAAAIIQLVIVTTHLIPLLNGHVLVWSGVLLRNGLYAGISGLFFVGAWEAQADRRFRQDAKSADRELRTPL